MKNRDVFLVTTSIKKTFPIKEKKLLLAGEWCKDDVNEFFLNKYVWMHYVDYACRLIIKE